MWTNALVYPVLTTVHVQTWMAVLTVRAFLGGTVISVKQVNILTEK